MKNIKVTLEIPVTDNVYATHEDALYRLDSYYLTELTEIIEDLLSTKIAKIVSDTERQVTEALDLVE